MHKLYQSPSGHLSHCHSNIHNCKHPLISNIVKSPEKVFLHISWALLLKQKVTVFKCHENMWVVLLLRWSLSLLQCVWSGGQEEGSRMKILNWNKIEHMQRASRREKNWKNKEKVFKEVVCLYFYKKIRNNANGQTFVKHYPHKIHKCDITTFSLNEDLIIDQTIKCTRYGFWSNP